MASSHWKRQEIFGWSKIIVHNNNNNKLWEETGFIRSSEKWSFAIVITALNELFITLVVYISALNTYHKGHESPKTEECYLKHD